LRWGCGFVPADAAVLGLGSAGLVADFRDLVAIAITSPDLGARRHVPDCGVR
jgi:hypothetical protein